MTPNQILGCALILAGLGDLVMLWFLRRRLPGNARILTLAISVSAAGLMAFGLTFLLRTG